MKRIIAIYLTSLFVIIISSLAFSFVQAQIPKEKLIEEKSIPISTEIKSSPREKQEKTEDKRLAEIYLALSEKNLKASESLLSAINWTCTFSGMAITLLITVLGFVGWKYFLPHIVEKEIKSWAEKSVEFNSIKQELKETSKEMNLALSQLYRNDGLKRWNEGIIDRSIELTVKSHHFFKKAFPKEIPKTKDEEIQWGTICGNLAYYYAQEQNHAKYAQALDYSKIALDIGKRYHMLHLVEDFIYVVKKFDVKDKEARGEAIQMLKNYKDEFIKYKILGEQEIKEYEEYYKK